VAGCVVDGAREEETFLAAARGSREYAEQGSGCLGQPLPTNAIAHCPRSVQEELQDLSNSSAD